MNKHMQNELRWHSIICGNWPESEPQEAKAPPDMEFATAKESIALTLDILRATGSPHLATGIERSWSAALSHIERLEQERDEAASGQERLRGVVRECRLAVWHRMPEPEQEVIGWTRFLAKTERLCGTASQAPQPEAIDWKARAEKAEADRAVLLLLADAIAAGNVLSVGTPPWLGEIVSRWEWSQLPVADKYRYICRDVAAKIRAPEPQKETP